MNEIFRKEVEKWVAALGSKDWPEVVEGRGARKGVSSVLDDPNLLWMEDDWDDERENEAIERIAKQGPDAPEFWTNKYIEKAPTYWKEFYKRNTTNFYKDRHYLHVVYPDLAPAQGSEGQEAADTPLHLLEVGCGVGNAVFPLLEINSRLRVHAFDCASSAVDLVRQHIASIKAEERMDVSVCDLVRETPPVGLGSMDFVLCMYVLSAIAPAYHEDCFRKLAACLKPKGRLLMRDYALFDEAQLRFSKGSKLFDNFYVRQDGTCAYYFSTQDMERLAKSSGLKVVENKYLRRQQQNRAQRKARYRIWVHVVLEKDA